PVQKKKKNKPKSKKSKGMSQEDSKGCKLFVGGLIFSDLDKTGLSFIEDLKILRIELICEMLTSLGTVNKIKGCWKQRYCHVIYSTPKIADDVMAKLSRSDFRKELTDAIQK